MVAFLGTHPKGLPQNEERAFFVTGASWILPPSITELKLLCSEAIAASDPKSFFGHLAKDWESVLLRLRLGFSVVQIGR